MTDSHERLAKALNSYVIILDTCFAMQESFPLFLRKHEDILTRNHIMVPYRVIQELQKVSGYADHRQPLADSALHSLEGARRDGLVEYRREPQDDQVINDAVISRVVEQLIPRRNVLVLTHDKNLTIYLYSKTRNECFNIKDVVVAGIGTDGSLFSWRNGNGTTSNEGGARQRPRRRPSVPAPPISNPFAICSTPAGALGSPLPVSSPIQEGDALRLRNGSSVILRKTLASGGEGVIHEVDDKSLLCKVYHPSKLTLDRQEKVELMASRPVGDPAICWPRHAVYDGNDTFRGFLMPRASGQPVPLGHSLFIPANFCRTRPDWTRLDSTRLAISILKRIKFLHDINVLVGDINPLNILFQDPDNVFLVDCDSCQVEGYPCPVGTVNFTAPEIQGSDFRRFLRTRDHELFSVATLLFMIFMPGKSPYSHQGGGDGAANIQKMHFPYALGERGSEAAPEGPWRLCWSHLPFTIKEAFNQSFHEDHRGKHRITIERWLLLLDKYARDLAMPNFVFSGPQEKTGFDLAILPENLRRVQKDGEIKPPWRGDGLTDRERTVRRLVADASQRRTAPARTRSPHPPVSTPASSPPAPARKPLSPDMVWTTVILGIAAAGGMAAVLWYFWGTSTGIWISLGTVAASLSGALVLIRYRWDVGLAKSLAIGLGLGGVSLLSLLVWYYWTPIVEFVKMLLVIAVVGVIIIGVVAWLSDR